MKMLQVCRDLAAIVSTSSCVVLSPQIHWQLQSTQLQVLPFLRFHRQMNSNLTIVRTSAIFVSNAFVAITSRNLEVFFSWHFLHNYGTWGYSSFAPSTRCRWCATELWQATATPTSWRLWRGLRCGVLPVSALVIIVAPNASSVCHASRSSSVLRHCRSKLVICLPYFQIPALCSVIVTPNVSSACYCRSRCVICLPFSLQMCHLSAILLDPSSVFRHCHSKHVICLPLSLLMRHLSALLPDPSSVFQCHA